VNNTDGLYFPAVSAGTTLYNYQLSTDNNTITFNSALPQGAVVFCERRTRDADSSYTSFASGSTIRATDLNNSSTESNFTAQDGRNKALEIEGAIWDGDQISSVYVTSANIVDGTIQTADIAADQITNALIADDQIDSEHIVADSLDTEHYAAGSVDNTALGADSVTNAKIADDQIDSEHYVALSIDTEHIANENVTTAKLAADAVTSAKLADNAVVTANIVDANVTHVKLANDAVDGDNIADDSINSEHYVDGSIDTAHIADSQITTAKIASDAVTNAKIADDSIDSEHYVDGSIDTAHIADAQVTTAKIADGAITDAKIQGGSLDNRYYTETELDAGQLDNRYYTETESDARYFNISTGDTIKDGDTFPDNDTTIATTAAINDRIIDLVDDVGGFVPIANETSFPTSNPDVNNGTGTLISIKAISSTRTPSGGIVTISNGAGTGNTVTISGCGSTVLTAGFGVIVETTQTSGDGSANPPRQYTFHRLVPKATEVTTVAGIASNITTVANNTSNINAVAADASDIGIVAADGTDIGLVAGSISNVNTTAGSIANVNTTASNITNVNNVGNNISNVNSVHSNASNINSAVSNASNINSAVSNASNINTVAGSISNVNTVGGAISNVNTTATNIADVNNFAGTYQIASSNPSTDGSGNSLAAGDLYFNTGSNELRVYNGSTWQGGVTATGNLAGLGTNTYTGNQTIENTAPKLLLTDSDSNSDYSVWNSNGNFRIYDETNGQQRMVLASDGTFDFNGNVDLNAGLDVTGNITVTGNVDGRDVAADGTKLDGISSSAIANVVQDTTPQLGGNLDVQSNKITTASSNTNVQIEPNGTGVVEIRGAGGYDGTLQLNCSQQSHGIKLRSPSHSAGASYTLTFPNSISANGALVTDANGNLTFQPVNTAGIGNDAVSTAKIAADAVTNAKIADDSIDSEHYVDGSIDTAHIADLQVTSDKIANTAITTAKLASNSVIGAKIANDSIDSNKLSSGSVTLAKIADNAITNGKINSNAQIAGSKLADGGISTAKIADDAVTAAKLADTSVSAGSYGSATAIPAITVDAQGRITAASTNSVNTTTNLSTSTATGSVTVNSSTGNNATISEATGSAAGVMSTAHHDKLDGIEASATADQTAAEIRTLVESASDSNVFTDADHTKLNGIASSANNYSHPNHSGEVTSSGDGATTIADNVVDEANLKISNSPTNGYFLSAQSGNTGGLTWAEVDLTALSASNLTSGTIPDARFPATLPAISGANLTGVASTTAGGAIYENSQTISTTHTIPSGSNGMSAGPVTVNNGVTLTISTGSTYTIV